MIVLRDETCAKHLFFADTLYKYWLRYVPIEDFNPYGFIHGYGTVYQPTCHNRYQLLKSLWQFYVADIVIAIEKDFSQGMIIVILAPYPLKDDVPCKYKSSAWNGCIIVYRLKFFSDTRAQNRFLEVSFSKMLMTFAASSVIKRCQL